MGDLRLDVSNMRSLIRLLAENLIKAKKLFLHDDGNKKLLN